MSGDKQRGRWNGKTKVYIAFQGKPLHIQVAEEKIGRALLPGEVVHHKDWNRRNNHPDNLEVLESEDEHNKIHFSGKTWVKQNGIRVWVNK